MQEQIKPSTISALFSSFNSMKEFKRPLLGAVGFFTVISAGIILLESYIQSNALGTSGGISLEAGEGLETDSLALYTKYAAYTSATTLAFMLLGIIIGQAWIKTLASEDKDAALPRFGPLAILLSVIGVSIKLILILIPMLIVAAMLGVSVWSASSSVLLSTIIGGALLAGVLIISFRLSLAIPLAALNARSETKDYLKTAWRLTTQMRGVGTLAIANILPGFAVSLVDIVSSLVASAIFSTEIIQLCFTAIVIGAASGLLQIWSWGVLYHILPLLKQTEKAAT